VSTTKILATATTVLVFLTTTKIARHPAHQLRIYTTTIKIETMAAIELGIEVETATAIPTSDQEIAPAPRTIHREGSETAVTIQVDIMIERGEI
jgi:hypothetical protein